MRLVVTADLHYDSLKSRLPTAELAEKICRMGGDALVLVGDSASAAHDPLRDCLNLFTSFGGRKFFVPGNHSLWCLPGETSLQRYEQIVPDIARACGFVMLDHEPTVMGDVGLVGSVGWYDYSYRDHQLDIPLEFYRAKLGPGAAERLPEHRALAEEFRHRLTDAHRNIATRWMDGVRMKMEMTDEEFLDFLVMRLQEQLAHMTADAKVRQVLGFVHHLPFRQLVPTGRPPPIAFAAAYMGSDKIGQAMLSCPKLTHVFCGHSHWQSRIHMGHAEIINVGSTYFEKRMEVLDL